MCVLGSPTPSCALPLFGDIIRVPRSHGVLRFFNYFGLQSSLQQKERNNSSFGNIDTPLYF